MLCWPGGRRSSCALQYWVHSCCSLNFCPVPSADLWCVSGLCFPVVRALPRSHLGFLTLLLLLCILWASSSVGAGGAAEELFTRWAICSFGTPSFHTFDHLQLTRVFKCFISISSSSLATDPKLSSNSESSCLTFSNTGITVCDTQLNRSPLALRQDLLFLKIYLLI